MRGTGFELADVPYGIEAYPKRYAFGLARQPARDLWYPSGPK